MCVCVCVIWHVNVLRRLLKNDHDDDYDNNKNRNNNINNNNALVQQTSVFDLPQASELKLDRAARYYAVLSQLALLTATTCSGK